MSNKEHKTLLEFLAEDTEKGLRIPRAAMAISGFGPRTTVDYHTENDIIVVLKRRMTAMELINAAYALEALSEKLIRHLADACGECGECEDCVCDIPDEDDFAVSDELRNDAGIPEGRKLMAEADASGKRIIITDAGYDHDLRDVPEEMLDEFIALGVPLCGLERHLRQEDIVYGGD